MIHDGIFVPINEDELECILCHQRSSNVATSIRAKGPYAHKITTDKGRWLCDGHGGFRHTRPINTLKELEEHLLRELHWESSFPEVKYCTKCNDPLVSEAHTIVHRANCGFKTEFIGSIGPKCPYCEKWTGCDLFTRIHLVTSHTAELLDHSPQIETSMQIRRITDEPTILNPGPLGRTTRSSSRIPQLEKQIQEIEGKTTQYKCEVCHQMFDQKEKKMRHFRENHLPKNLENDPLLDLSLIHI